MMSFTSSSKCLLTSSADFPSTTLDMLCHRSGVSLSYIAKASSNWSFCLWVQDEVEFLEEELKFDVIVGVGDINTVEVKLNE